MTTIYRLTADIYDPRFEQFEFPENAASLLGNDRLDQDFEGTNRAKLSWQPNRLAEVWTPQSVVGPVAPYNDYPCVSRIPAFSERAVAALRDLLEPNGELLPLKTEVGNYYAFNILKKSTALNLDDSDATFAPGSAKETAIKIKKFAFDEYAVEDHVIFRIREYPVAVLVTDTFKQRVESAALNGFYFIQLWPMADGASWEDVELQRKRKRAKQLKPLRGQTLTIRLGIKGREPNSAELASGYALVNTIADQLSKRQSSLRAPFLGSVHDLEQQDSYLLAHLACPDVDRLASEIRYCLLEYNWENSLTIELRYGNRYDETAVTRTERLK